MSSVSDELVSPIKPFFAPHPERPSESAKSQQIIDTLHLQNHPEGGYFVETDRDPARVANPFVSDPSSEDTTRNASTSIFYFLTPELSKGSFHRNKGRTVHTLHKGRGRYVIIHADQAKDGGKAPIETFVVGQDLAKGEKLQWIVEGGKYKASFLLPDGDKDSREGESEGLLISEVGAREILFSYRTDGTSVPPLSYPLLFTSCAMLILS